MYRCLCFVFVLSLSALVSAKPYLPEEKTPALEMAILEEVVITASRSASSVLNLPYSARRISQLSLQQKRPRTLPEALNGIAGVAVQKTANGQGSPFIRGFTGYRTLSLIDGVRYNNSVYRDGANEYFSLIDINSLQSIELLSGPASVLYGSDAIGGTLNLQTQSALDQPGGRFVQSYRYSSAENSHISRSQLALGQDQTWGLLVGYSWKSFGDVKAAELGEQKHTGYDESAYDMRLDLQLSSSALVTLVHQNLQQDDVWRTHSTIFAESFAGSQVGSDQRRLKDQQRDLSYINLRLSDYFAAIDELSVTLSQQNWHESGDRIRDDGQRNLSYFDSEMLGFDLQIKQHWLDAVWSYGFDYYVDQVDSGRRDFFANGQLKAQRVQGPIGDDSEYRLFGVYGQLEYLLSDQLSFILGSRYTQTKASVGSFEDPLTGVADSFSDQWRDSVSSLRISYQFEQLTLLRLWGGVSQSFRAPNIGDLSRFGRSRSNEIEIAATKLEPEKFLTYELGLKYGDGRGQFNLSYYYTQIDDFISSTATGNLREGLIEVSKANSAAGFVQGVEISGRVDLSAQLSLTANVSWLDSQLDTAVAGGSEVMSRLMPLSTSLSLQFQWLEQNTWWRLDANYVSQANRLSGADKNDLQRIPPGGTPAYFVLNVAAGVALNKNIELDLALKNVTDEAYRAHGSGSNEPGRGVTLALTASF